MQTAVKTTKPNQTVWKGLAGQHERARNLFRAIGAYHQDYIRPDVTMNWKKSIHTKLVDDFYLIARAGMPNGRWSVDAMTEFQEDHIIPACDHVISPTYTVDMLLRDRELTKVKFLSCLPFFLATERVTYNQNTELAAKYKSNLEVSRDDILKMCGISIFVHEYDRWDAFQLHRDIFRFQYPNESETYRPTTNKRSARTSTPVQTDKYLRWKESTRLREIYEQESYLAIQEVLEKMDAMQQ